MSRGSRGRHRRRGRPGRTVDATVPLAVGGAVAAVALVGPSVGVKLLRPEESPASAGPQAEGSRERGTLMTFSEPSSPGPVATLVPRAAGSAASRSADRDATRDLAAAGATATGTATGSSAGTTSGTGSTSSSSPTSSGSGGGSTGSPSPTTTPPPDDGGSGPIPSLPLPSTTASVPLPTLSPPGLP